MQLFGGEFYKTEQDFRISRCFKVEILPQLDVTCNSLNLKATGLIYYMTNFIRRKIIEIRFLIFRKSQEVSRSNVNFR